VKHDLFLSSLIGSPISIAATTVETSSTGSLRLDFLTHGHKAFAQVSTQNTFGVQELE
jgi:hypothetical protein